MATDLADTIVAIGSAAGGAGRGVIRVSGPNVVAVVGRCFRTSAEDPSGTVHPRGITGEFVFDAGAPPLPADLFLWPNEQSYTRQPSAELHTFGSPALLQLAVAVMCRLGARLAEPGEFTLRAFLAGRLDLTQAEAVLGVIDATTEEALHTALGQLAGGLSKPLGDLRERLLELLAHLEAGLDFVDEDISFISSAEIERQLAESSDLVAAILAQLQARREPQILPKIILAGKPNAGKSSLFNVLVERFSGTSRPSRALVSERAGTTRDYLSARVDLGGITCELIDTAGVGSADTEGILDCAQEMASVQRKQAICTVTCIDSTSPTAKREIAEYSGREGEVLVVTKIDLLSEGQYLPQCSTAISCSSRTGEGIDRLVAEVVRIVGHQDVNSTVASTASRCLDSLTRAQESLQVALRLVAGNGGDELVAAEIRNTLQEIGRVVGAVYTDDILDRVFSTFCIGK